MKRPAPPRALALLGGLVLALAACETRPPPPAPSARPVPKPARPAAPRAPSAADYFAAASSIDLFEVQSSQFALQHLRHAGLREFAAMMVSSHSGTAAQLSFAGRRLNLLPGATLEPRHQAMMSQLAASSDIDRTYRAQQIEVHEAALRLHSSYAARGTSPTLRPVARNAEQIVIRHLALLRRL